jgi:D-amino-acid oxidase
VQVTVVGAGVIGLTAAVELERAGHDVTVIAAHTGDRTTSAVAGAIWFPYRAGPPEAVTRWAARTRSRLTDLAHDAPEAGVDLITLVELVADEDAPWWIAAAPDAAPVVTDLPGRPRAWRLTVPRVEPALFLPWLASQLSRPIETGRVTDLAEVPGDVVVNATGLGARTLAHDPTVVGLAGQVAIASPGDLDLSTSICDDRDEDAMFYAIPRRDSVVLGGSATLADVLPPEDPALTSRILADAARFDLHPGAVERVRIGLRPYRPTVRLERDGRVIHCYGHGGAGYTLCVGCAEELVALL